MANLNLQGVFTITVTNAKYIIPDGSLEIFMENIGAADGKWEGNILQLGLGASAPITLKKGESFAYGCIGKGRQTLTIDATGTIIQLSITY